jgi:hypothetical protein
VVDLGAVDRPALVHHGDSVIDASAEQEVHPARVEGLQPHRIVPFGRELGQRLDEAHRPAEVAAVAIVEGETEMGGELVDGWGAAHHQLRCPFVRLLCFGCAQSAQREERDPELHLQPGLSTAALVAFGKPRRERDSTGEVVDCALVRGEPDRSHACVV